MRFAASLLIALGFIAVPAAPAASPNLLKNASFEAASPDGEDQAANWSRWGDWMNRECGWSPVRDGICILGYHHWQITKAESSGLWQDAEGIEAGKSYTFRIYANADHPTAAATEADKVELRLECTLDGRQVTVNSRTYRVKHLATGEEWSPLEVSGTAANNTLRALLILHPASDETRDGSVKFDEASLALSTGL